MTGEGLAGLPTGGKPGGEQAEIHLQVAPRKRLMRDAKGLTSGPLKVTASDIFPSGIRSWLGADVRCQMWQSVGQRFPRQLAPFLSLLWRTSVKLLSPTWLSSLFAPDHKASSNPDFPNISIVGFPSLSGQITKLVLADLQFGLGHLVSDGLGTVPAEVNLL